MDPAWSTLRVAGVALDIPDELAPTDERGVEGGAAVLEGSKLRLTLDASPFADPLTRYTDKPGYEHWREIVGGLPADFVSFEDQGTRIVATNIAGRATAVVHIPADADRSVALQILRSIRTDQGEFDD
ncbi:hypothetical protein J1902_10335 [Arthrobacter sp. PO-11]|uniref:Uncharacterized protein n=1 Tax=Arthrobacter cavernae TaxID=2817681 RepID=A0A939HHH5_9MICC|nr:hypothetical protein [Arthrobacter cavernae]